MTCARCHRAAHVWHPGNDGRPVCSRCYDLEWDAQIDAEADRLERAMSNLGRPLPTGDAPTFA